jgi:uncharacterized protein YndB with AHSA1/START domain
MPEASRKHEDFVAEASILVGTKPEDVWRVLTTPELMKEVMFGSDVKSDWKVGSPITFSGVWEGKPFEDKGTILEIDPPHLLQTTFFSPSSGKPDVPENYSEVTYRLEPDGSGTRVTCTQTNNPTQEAADNSTRNWNMVLATLKTVAER